MPDIRTIVENATDKLAENTPEIIKDNKGALIGAVIGLLLTNSEKGRSALLGAIAGSLIGDKKNGNE